MATPTPPKNDEEAAALEQQLQEYRANKIREEATARNLSLEPMRVFVTSPEFKQIEEQSAAMARDFRDFETIDVNLRLIGPTMTRLRNAVEGMIVPVETLAT